MLSKTHFNEFYVSSPGFVDITLHTTTMRKKITMRMMMHPTKDIRVTADMVSW